MTPSITFRIAEGLLGFFGVALSVPTTTHAASAPASGLKNLIEGARKEGRLNVTVVTSQGAKGGEALGEAFKRRFGLGDMKITFDLNQGTAGDGNKAIPEHQS